GSARDEDKLGLAQMTNSMLDEGTKQFTVDEIARRFDEVGAIFSNHTDRDLSYVGLRSLTDPKYFDSALSTFIAVLTDANFPEDNFNRLKKQILVALNQSDQDPATLARKNFMKTLYGNLPYNHPVPGTIEAVNQLTEADVKHFYQQYYNAKNAMIAMV